MLFLHIFNISKNQLFDFQSLTTLKTPVLLRSERYDVAFNADALRSITNYGLLEITPTKAERVPAFLSRQWYFRKMFVFAFFRYMKKSII
jgi:hypothetical protein